MRKCLICGKENKDSDNYCYVCRSELSPLFTEELKQLSFLTASIAEWKEKALLTDDVYTKLDGDIADKKREIQEKIERREKEIVDAGVRRMQAELEKYVHYNSGFANGILIAKRILELRPDSVPTLVAVGQLYLGQGNKKLAMKNFEDAAEIEPENDRLKKIIADLRAEEQKEEERKAAREKTIQDTPAPSDVAAQLAEQKTSQAHLDNKPETKPEPELKKRGFDFSWFEYLNSFLEEKNIRWMHFTGASILLAGLIGVVRWQWGILGSYFIALLLAGSTIGLYWTGSKLYRKYETSGLVMLILAALLFPLDIAAANKFGIFGFNFNWFAYGTFLSFATLGFYIYMVFRFKKAFFCYLSVLAFSVSLYFCLQIWHTPFYYYGLFYLPSAIGITYLAYFIKRSGNEWIAKPLLQSANIIMLACLAATLLKTDYFFVKAIGQTSILTAMAAMLCYSMAYLFGQNIFNYLGSGLFIAFGASLFKGFGVAWYHYGSLFMAISLLFLLTSHFNKAKARNEFVSSYRGMSIVLSALTLFAFYGKSFGFDIWKGFAGLKQGELIANLVVAILGAFIYSILARRQERKDYAYIAVVVLAYAGFMFGVNINRSAIYYPLYLVILGVAFALKGISFKDDTISIFAKPLFRIGYHALVKLSCIAAISYYFMHKGIMLSSVVVLIVLLTSLLLDIYTGRRLQRPFLLYNAIAAGVIIQYVLWKMPFVFPGREIANFGLIYLPYNLLLLFSGYMLREKGRDDFAAPCWLSFLLLSIFSLAMQLKQMSHLYDYSSIVVLAVYALVAFGLSLYFRRQLLCLQEKSGFLSGVLTYVGLLLLAWSLSEFSYLQSIGFDKIGAYLGIYSFALLATSIVFRRWAVKGKMDIDQYKLLLGMPFDYSALLFSFISFGFGYASSAAQMLFVLTMVIFNISFYAFFNRAEFFTYLSLVFWFAGVPKIFIGLDNTIGAKIALLFFTVFSLLCWSMYLNQFRKRLWTYALGIWGAYTAVAFFQLFIIILHIPQNFKNYGLLSIPYFMLLAAIAYYTFTKNKGEHIYWPLCELAFVGSLLGAISEAYFFTNGYMVSSVIALFIYALSYFTVTILSKHSLFSAEKVKNLSLFAYLSIITALCGVYTLSSLMDIRLFYLSMVALVCSFILILAGVYVSRREIPFFKGTIDEREFVWVKSSWNCAFIVSALTQYIVFGASYVSVAITLTLAAILQCLMGYLRRQTFYYSFSLLVTIGVYFILFITKGVSLQTFNLENVLIISSFLVLSLCWNFGAVDLKFKRLSYGGTSFLAMAFMLFALIVSTLTRSFECFMLLCLGFAFILLGLNRKLAKGAFAILHNAFGHFAHLFAAVAWVLALGQMWHPYSQRPDFILALVFVGACCFYILCMQAFRKSALVYPAVFVSSLAYWVISKITLLPILRSVLGDDKNFGLLFVPYVALLMLVTFICRKERYWEFFRALFASLMFFQYLSLVSQCFYFLQGHSFSLSVSLFGFAYTAIFILTSFVYRDSLLQDTEKFMLAKVSVYVAAVLMPISTYLLLHRLVPSEYLTLVFTVASMLITFLWLAVGRKLSLRNLSSWGWPLINSSLVLTVFAQLITLCQIYGNTILVLPLSLGVIYFTAYIWLMGKREFVHIKIVLVFSGYLFLLLGGTSHLVLAFLLSLLVSSIILLLYYNKLESGANIAAVISVIAYVHFLKWAMLPVDFYPLAFLPVAITLLVLGKKRISVLSHLKKENLFQLGILLSSVSIVLSLWVGNSILMLCSVILHAIIFKYLSWRSGKQTYLTMAIASISLAVLKKSALYFGFNPHLYLTGILLAFIWYITANLLEKFREDTYLTGYFRFALSLLVVSDVLTLAAAIYHSTDIILMVVAFILSAMLYALYGHRMGKGILVHSAAVSLLLAYYIPVWVSLVREIDFYLIPLGLYLMAIGYYNRKRNVGGNSIQLYGIGLLVLFGSSYKESFGPGGTIHAIILCLETLTAIFVGFYHRFKVYLFLGVAFFVVNVITQSFAFLVSIHWAIYAVGTGVMLITAGVIFERKREFIVQKQRQITKNLSEWQ